MMCSVAMPTDYEVPAFHRPPHPVRRPASLNLSVNITHASAPRRPILVVRPGGQEEAVEVVTQDRVQDPAEQLSPTRLKKRVVFADDAGRQLTHVKVMTEPSFAPPRWSMAFLAQVTRGAAAEVCPEPWEPTFAQPASDYLAFRRRLDQDNVSLENVIVREAEQTVVGTVKVKNLAFNKEVLVRSTWDDWATHEDAYCTYVKNGPSGSNGSTAAAGVPVLYDTFSFRLTLPPQSRRLEFCVRFRAEGHSQDYWDSNGGKNYVLLKKCSPYNPVPSSHAFSTVDQLTAKIGELSTHHDYSMSSPKHHDIYSAKLDSWSEFASWNHTNMDGPYW